MKFLKEYGLHIFFILFGMLARYQYNPDRNFTDWIRHALISGFAGSMGIMVVEHYAFSPPLKGFIVGVVAFLADDLLRTTLYLGTEMRKDPTSFLKRFRK